MFNLSFVTPEKTIYEGEAKSLIVPGVEGYFEVLAHHMPILAGLQPGKVILTLPDGKKNLYAVAFGFLEVDKNTVHLLADSAELSKDIDLLRAKAALKRAMKYLETQEVGTDPIRAKEALKRAEARIEVVKEFEHKRRY